MRRGRNRDQDWSFNTKRDAALAGVAAPHVTTGRERRAQARAAVALLGQVAVLREVAPTVLAELAGAVWEMDYPAGRVVAAQGSRVDTGLVVLDGTVIELRGRERVAEHGPQTLLGLDLTPGVHVAASTLVIGTAVRAVVVDRAVLAAVAARHDALAAALAGASVAGQVVVRPRTEEETAQQARAGLLRPRPSLGLAASD